MIFLLFKLLNNFKNTKFTILNSNKTQFSNSTKSYKISLYQSSTFYNKNIKLSKLSKYNNLLKIKPSGFHSSLHFGYTNLKQNRTFHKSSVLNFKKPNFFKNIFLVKIHL